MGRIGPSMNVINFNLYFSVHTSIFVMASNPAIKRGRAYECLKCKNFVGERDKVIHHLYKHHVPLAEVPFYCTLCSFRCSKWRALMKHIKGYPLHAQMKKTTSSLDVDDLEYLRESEHPYSNPDADMRKLSMEESQEVWSGRCGKRIKKSSGVDAELENTLLELSSSLVQPMQIIETGDQAYKIIDNSMDILQEALTSSDIIPTASSNTDLTEVGLSGSSCTVLAEVSSLPVSSYPASSVECAPPTLCDIRVVEATKQAPSNTMATSSPVNLPVIVPPITPKVSLPSASLGDDEELAPIDLSIRKRKLESEEDLPPNKISKKSTDAPAETSSEIHGHEYLTLLQTMLELVKTTSELQKTVDGVQKNWQAATDKLNKRLDDHEKKMKALVDGMERQQKTLTKIEDGVEVIRTRPRYTTEKQDRLPLYSKENYSGHEHRRYRH